jgi:molybdenum cofactor cytidylyltransferase
VITGLILAAGASSRMGRTKQLLSLGGRPLLQHVVDAAEAAPIDEIVVVLGHRAREIAAALRWPARMRVAVNPAYGEGQSTSLIAGVRAAHRAARAVVVLLGDQPGIRTAAIAAVVEAFEAGAGPVVQASYEGRPGHPALIARPLWGEVERISGDEGARSILPSDPADRRLVEVGGPAPEDIDTEDDFARLFAQWPLQ